MKKIMLAAVGFAFAASIASAQVTSANIVGYNKDTANAAGLHISGMQFLNETNTPTSVYGDQLPKGSKIYKFDGSYTIVTYTDVFVPIQGLVTKWSSEVDLGNGDGYWVEVPSASEAILSGEVSTENSITNNIEIGLQLVSYPYPVERVITNLGFTPAKGDKIYVYDGSYTIITYTDVFVPIQGLVTKWSNETLSIGVGEGFWYEAVSPQTWIANKPF